MLLVHAKIYDSTILNAQCFDNELTQLSLQRDVMVCRNDIIVLSGKITKGKEYGHVRN
jgi:hypothetical protein